MGNAHTHERRKSGVTETGLTIEDIRDKPDPLAPRDREVVGRGDKKTPPPSFQTQKSQSGSTNESCKSPTPSAPLSPGSGDGFRPRAGTHVGSSGVSRKIKAPDTGVNASKGLPTIFKYPGTAKEAYVAGTFSQWEKIPMVKSQKDFVALIDLPVGEHQFKYYVDNEWKLDKGIPSIDNEVGSENNVISIQQDDFEAFAALDMDSKVTRERGTRETEFGQDIPGLNSFENKPGPPILPPHLLQVILNKDTPLSCEPTLLPEPNHVMINHLYALSIKDGVMVISSTQRFRKKYVTTLLYKPIENC